MHYFRARLEEKKKKEEEKRRKEEEKQDKVIKQTSGLILEIFISYLNLKGFNSD